MFNHAPDGYVCPFCLFTQGIENGHVLSVQADRVFQDEAVTALISSHQYVNNLGHVLILSTQHFENIFDLLLEIAAQIHAITRRIAVVMKSAYQCDGVSTRQHNEPAGNQDVWHYHQHPDATRRTGRLRRTIEALPLSAVVSSLFKKIFWVHNSQD